MLVTKSRSNVDCVQNRLKRLFYWFQTLHLYFIDITPLHLLQPCLHNFSLPAGVVDLPREEWVVVPLCVVTLLLRFSWLGSVHSLLPYTLHMCHLLQEELHCSAGMLFRKPYSVLRAGWSQTIEWKIFTQPKGLLAQGLG